MIPTGATKTPPIAITVLAVHTNGSRFTTASKLIIQPYPIIITNSNPNINLPITVLFFLN